MMNADAATGLSGFLEWSEPVIFDRLLQEYQDHIGAGRRSWELARLHSRAWRALLSGRTAEYDLLRSNLFDALDNCKLDAANVVDADAQILVELLDIVMTRYQRSLRTAKGYHLALISLAARLAPQAHAA